MIPLGKAKSRIYATSCSISQHLVSESKIKSYRMILWENCTLSPYPQCFTVTQTISSSKKQSFCLTLWIGRE